MERLTERIKRLQKDDLIVYTKGKYEGAIPAEMTNDDIRAVLKKLAAYEDLEEQGLLVRLPDDLLKGIYRITYKYTECSNGGETKDCCENYNCSRECDSRKELYIVKNRLEFMLFCNYYNELGKTIFLTREKAKKRLEEMKK